MYLKIAIIFICVIMVGSLFYKYIIKQNEIKPNPNSNSNSNFSQCKMNLDKMCPTIKLSFKEKVCNVFTNETILKRLIKEPEYNNSIGISVYPNKLINLMDGLMIGLGHYMEKPTKEMENMLYEQIEPELDKILNES